MTLAGIYLGQFTVLQYMEFCLRLVIAFIIGGIIGQERSMRFKEAGIRTHILVCCTAALIMLISKYGFADMGSSEVMEFYGSKGADTARVAAQAVSGISFLCAGVIIKVGGNIRGLTTAAGIWMTAGVGLAIGAGMYVITGFTVLLMWLLQYVLYRLMLSSDAHDGYHLKFVVKNSRDFEALMQEQIRVWKAQITENSISWTRSGTTEYDYVIRRTDTLRYSEIKDFADRHEDIVSFSFIPLQPHVP